MAKTSYLVLARKYRPKTFDEVIGQDFAVQTLRNAILSNRVGQAYLFAGPRGVGKTTMARLLSKSLNCLDAPGPTITPCNHCEACAAIAAGDDIDVLEIDGASNRKVEESRDLRQTVQYAPARSRFKIYIIDEVHMLTTEAFNTLLKTLEEPPEKVKFLFATTQPYKVPETILSRCQRLDFRRIPTRLIAHELERIAREEALEIEPDALGAVARAARGGMRDALSLLDLLLAQGKGKITLSDMNAVLGYMPQSSLAALSASLWKADLRGALNVFYAALEQGTDVGQFIDQALEHFRNLLLVKSCGKDAPGLDELEETVDQLAAQAKDVSLDALLYAIQVLADTASRIRTSTQAQVLAELALIKLSRLQDVRPVSELLTRLGRLEQSLSSGRTSVLAEPTSSYSVESASETDAATDVPAPAADSPFSELWSRILELLEQKKRTLAATLNSQCRLLEASDGRLVIGLFRSAAFHKRIIEDLESIAAIQACAQEITGTPWQVSVKLVSSMEPTGTSELQEPHSSGHRPAFRPTTTEADALPAAERPAPEARRTFRNTQMRSQAQQQSPPTLGQPDGSTGKDVRNEPVVRKVAEFFRGQIL